MKYKVGERVVGRNIFGKGKLSLVVRKAFEKKGIYLCQVENTDISMPYLESELEKRL